MAPLFWKLFRGCLLISISMVPPFNYWHTTNPEEDSFENAQWRKVKQKHINGATVSIFRCISTTYPCPSVGHTFEFPFYFWPEASLFPSPSTDVFTDLFSPILPFIFHHFFHRMASLNTNYIFLNCIFCKLYFLCKCTWLAQCASSELWEFILCLYFRISGILLIVFLAECQQIFVHFFVCILYS